MPHGVLDPPAGGAPWPVGFAVERLGRTHSQEVARWLEGAYKRWGASEAGAAFVALAARDCLPAASATLLRALRAYPRSSWIGGQAMHALEVMDPSDPFIDDTALVLLDPDEPALAGVAPRTIQALVDGMNLDNADARISLLARKLAAAAESRYLLFMVMPSASLLSRWSDPAGCWGWSNRGFDGWMARCRAAQGPLGTTRGAAMGFRRAGRGTYRRQNRTKSAADPRRCQPLGRQRPLPRQPQVADEPAGEAKLAVGRCHGPGEPVGLFRGPGPGQGPVQGLLPKADGVLDVEAADVGPPQQRQIRGGTRWAGPPQPQRLGRPGPPGQP